jgi:hypothetical protein
MIMLPALIGAALATATVFFLSRVGVLRSGVVALVLVAMAGFWPLFAVATQDDGQIVLHITLFFCFATAAVLSNRIGIQGLAFTLIAHSILDAALFTTVHPGPLWWPVFSAGYGVALGGLLLISLRKGDIA